MDYAITFTQQEIGTLYAALGELPLKHSANLFGKIQTAVAEQDGQKAMPIEDFVTQIEQQ